MHLLELRMPVGHSRTEVFSEASKGKGTQNEVNTKRKSIMCQ